MKGDNLHKEMQLYEFIKANNGKVYGTLRKLGEQFGVTDRTVYTYIKKLLKQGLINRECRVIGTTKITILTLK